MKEVPVSFTAWPRMTLPALLTAPSKVRPNGAADVLTQWKEFAAPKFGDAKVPVALQSHAITEPNKSENQIEIFRLCVR